MMNTAQWLSEWKSSLRSSPGIWDWSPREEVIELG
jgi:hypothetical protein